MNIGIFPKIFLKNHIYEKSTTESFTDVIIIAGSKGGTIYV